MTVLRTLSVLVALATAFPATAQVAAGPYSKLSVDEDMMLAVAEGTKARSGSTGRITVVTLLSPAKSTEVGQGIIRVDSTYEFQCNARNARVTASTAYDSNGASLSVLNAPTEWTTVDPDSTIEGARAFVCDGTRPNGGTTDTVDQLMEWYYTLLIVFAD